MLPQPMAETFAVWPAKAGEDGSVGFHPNPPNIFLKSVGCGPSTVKVTSTISAFPEHGTVFGWTYMTPDTIMGYM